jgi:hypothetical protein
MDSERWSRWQSKVKQLGRCWLIEGRDLFIRVVYIYELRGDF